MKKLILSVFALAAVVLSANAQTNTKTTAATAGGEIITPITLTNDGTVLQFGRIAVGTAATGTVVIAPASGDQTGTAAATDVSLVAGTSRQATPFVVGGKVGCVYGVTLPPNGFVLDAGLAIDFTDNATHTIVNGAGDVFYVGGTLTITKATAVVGPHTQSFNVTVTYN